MTDNEETQKGREMMIEHWRQRNSDRHGATGFIKFSNAYKGEKDDHTKFRLCMDNIITYEAVERNIDSNCSHVHKETLRDLKLGGDKIYSIYIRYNSGGGSEMQNVYFWNEKQRDRTLKELDEVFGTYEPTPGVTMRLINPSVDGMPVLPKASEIGNSYTFNE